MTDTIADLLTRIRNAHRALLTDIELPHSKMKQAIAAILKKEGYIVDFSVEGKTIKRLKLKLKYDGRRSVITGIRRVSSPGLRRYVGSTEIPRVRGGLGTAILSTSQGVMSGAEARKQNLGGELLCYVW
ncbi:MAG: 30S ribosomal protein S8 [Verrucomicrobiales bacterium]|jgi:small subunit ribosomal protein S8|nr:30S ribosomal protein S8 [Verrucomicrobiales bacterium]